MVPVVPLFSTQQ